MCERWVNFTMWLLLYVCVGNVGVSAVQSRCCRTFAAVVVVPMLCCVHSSTRYVYVSVVWGSHTA